MNISLRHDIQECGCDLVESCLPRLVLTARNEESLSKLMILAALQRLRIIPTGTGASFSADFQAPRDAVFLLMNNFNQILDLQWADGVALLEAGALVSLLRDKLLGTEMQLPETLSTYPGTMAGAMLRPDPTGLRQAEVRRRLLGIEMVDPKGHLVKFGGSAVKNVAGYDLWTFLVGTDGRFGILTKIYLKLEKMPPLAVPAPAESQANHDENTRWIFANLEKRFDPDGIFAR